MTTTAGLAAGGSFGTPASEPMLRGRDSECELLEGVVASVRAGQSRTVVLRGEPGIGKTALLEYLLQRASGCRLARAAGVESEVELPFAGLHRLCVPMLAGLDAVPSPQRDALATAFGLRSGDAPDRFLVGLAVHSLLSNAAEEQPLVCVVDDVQWFDQVSAEVLVFVARRLLAESVALVFGVRSDARDDVLAGLPELKVRGLGRRDATALLDSVVTGRMDGQVRDRIVAETRGNPLALLELPRGMTPEELAGGFGFPDAPPLSARIEESFRRRLTPLPSRTQRLLLLAAAEPVGDPVVLWRAASELGIGFDAAAPAVTAGLVEFAGNVLFHHPLVRSAVYRAASHDDRMSVHRALADATDGDVDPDRRAWHRAQATAGLDEDVAAELERSADRARSRGGFAAAAAFLDRAVALTPARGRRAQRALAAAQSKYLAGAPDAALRLLALAEAGPLDELERAHAQLLRAQITFVVTRGRDAPPLLLKAAKRLEALDPALARETYLDAFVAALCAGRLGDGGGMRDIAEAFRTADWQERFRPSGRACDALLDGLVTLIIDGYEAAAPALKHAVVAFRREPMSEQRALRWLWLACRVARALGDDEAWDELTDRQVKVARDAGALSVLPIALSERSKVELFLGNFAMARYLVAEADAAVRAAGSTVSPAGAVALAAWAGDETQTRAHFDAGRQDADRRGEGIWLTSSEWARAELLNALGRWDEALSAAEWVAAEPEELGSSTWVAAELVEAATRSGKLDRAREALPQLTELARASGTDWALGIAALSRALLTQGRAADELYGEAIERLERIRIRVPVARAHLLYGEWLRRENRRVEAREHLRIAHTMFDAMGADGFDQRARRELLATGETARKRRDETRADLTGQEAQIARLAAAGSTNPEIGAQLYLSPRTVEWHLRKVYAKLSITSRRELRGALATAAAA
jgi:DNA-binding CsgD family transcriptional regulator